MSRTRICLVSEIFHPEDQGGQGQQAFALARRIHADGIDVRVVTRCNFVGSKRHEILDGVQVVRLSPTGLYKGRGWTAVLPTLWFLISLSIHLLRTARTYDLILVHGAKAILIPPLMIGSLLRKPCIVKIDSHAELDQDISTESLARMQRRSIAGLIHFWGRLRTALLRKASAIIAISAEIEAALIRKLGSNIPIVRIPNGIDLSRWSSSGEPRDSIRQRLELPQGLLITYCGRLSRAKGLPMLLQVWSRLAPRHMHAHLVLVGGGDRSPDNCESELRDIVRSSGLETRVSFIGQVENVTDYLRASDLFVLPSDSEGFGLSLIEAMAAGLPSVSTAVGVAPEVITDGETGWLVPPRDATALENAIETALNSRGRWASIGRLGQRQVEKFEMTEVAREYETLIERTCSFAGASLTSKSRVRANASWLLGCRITADLLNFVLFVIVTNLFGPAGMGVYAYGFAIAGFVYAATTLGIDEYGIREYVRRSGDERNQLISELLGAQVLVGLAAFAALAIYLYVTAATSDVLVIVASLSIYQLCAALSNTMFVPSMAEQRMMRPALTVLVSRAAALGAAGLLMWLAHAALMWALVPFAISGVFMLVLAATSARSEGARLHPQISRSVLHDAGRNLWSFATIDIMGQLFTRIGVIGLMLWANEHAAGIYAAGLKLAEVACMPLLFLGQAAYPTLSRAYTRPREFRSLSRQALLWGSLIAIVIAVAMALLVPVLLVPLLGQGYAGSEPIIAAMSALALMQGWEIVIGRLLLAANLSIARAKWVSIGAVICALSTALLTPKFGVTAAVIATVSSYAIVDALYLRTLLKTLRRNSHAEHETTLAEPAQRKVAA